MKIKGIPLIGLTLILYGCANPAQQRMLEYRQRNNNILNQRGFIDGLNRAACHDSVYSAADKVILNARLAGLSVLYPKIKKTVAPNYPMEERIKWREATLHFAIIIDKNGCISYLRYIPHPDIEVDTAFINAGEEAIRNWIFEAGMIDGKASEFPVIVPVQFLLQ